MYALETSTFSDWYVFDPAPLNDASPITADNFNAQTNQAGTTGTVYLEFPERVFGKGIVTGYTQNGVVTSLANGHTFDLDVSGSSGGVVRDKAVGGCTGGTCAGDAIHYRVTLPSGVPAIEDHRADSPNLVEVLIDATDAEGNHISKTVTLPVE